MNIIILAYYYNLIITLYSFELFIQYFYNYDESIKFLGIANTLNPIP